MTNMVQPKGDKIEETKANLPLPADPPVKSDFNSSDPSTVNVGSGRTEGQPGTGDAATSGLKSPATKGDAMDLSNVGRQGKDNLDSVPKDASY